MGALHLLPLFNINSWLQNKIKYLYYNMQSSLSIIQELPHFFVCPLCFQDMNNEERMPMMLCQYQHFACKACVQYVLFRKAEEKCPTCKDQIAKQKVKKFRFLDELIEARIKLKADKKIGKKGSDCINCQTLRKQIQVKDIQIKTLQESIHINHPLMEQQKKLVSYPKRVGQGGVEKILEDRFIEAAQSHKWCGKVSEWSHFQKMKTIDVSECNLVSLPQRLFHLVELENLFIYGNQLTELPQEIGNLKSLQVLSILKNKISSLPEAMQNLSKIKILALDFVLIPHQNLFAKPPYCSYKEMSQITVYRQKTDQNLPLSLNEECKRRGVELKQIEDDQ